MKIVSNQTRKGVAARKVKKPSSAQLRNPALKQFDEFGDSQSFGMAGMGDWWDSLTDTLSETADKLWDSAVNAGQKAATTYVQKELMKIVGADGKVKEVPVGSAEAIAFQQQYNQQQQQLALSQASNSNDKMMTYMLYGMGGLGALIAVALVVKVIKK